MPKTAVILFADEEGSCPFIEWLYTLPRKPRDKVVGYVERLEQFGNQLRRPIADSLNGGIMELRPSYMGINYRVLYFYCGRNAVVISHGIVKQGDVPAREIELAIERMEQFIRDPAKHTYLRPDLWRKI